MSLVFANYHRERAAFHELLDDTCCMRILLLKGASGSGKTSLLKACLDEVPAEKPIINIQLRSNAVSVTEIFSRSAKRIGWENLTRFSHCAQELAGRVPRIDVSGVQQNGESNALNIALNVQSINDRVHHQTLLTDAWFEDVEKLDAPLVMVLDTYENATIEVQDWLSGPFLARTADCNMVRVAVAGQTVPDAGIEWNRCHTLYELYGVSDAREWLPVVTALGKKVPVEPAEIWLGGICYSLKGEPAAIMEVIKTFPDACSLMLESVRQ